MQDNDNCLKRKNSALAYRNVAELRWTWLVIIAADALAAGPTAALTLRCQSRAIPVIDCSAKQLTAHKLGGLFVVSSQNRKFHARHMEYFSLHSNEECVRECVRSHARNIRRKKEEMLQWKTSLNGSWHVRRRAET
jgi:hypothetical protein